MALPPSTLIESQVDGGPLELFSMGSGPGVVIVAGGGTDASVYGRLAQRLSGAFTVHCYNRRGRRRSAARPADYGLATEIGDLGSVLASTGSTRVLGHSVGGFFALVGGRDLLGITRLALFDPTVSVDGGFPWDFLPEFERLVAAGDNVAALAEAGRGLQNPGASLPRWVQRGAVRLLMLTPPGRTIVELVPTVPAESRLAMAADGPAAQWSGVQARTRFYIGARSPRYYLPAARQLVSAMPDADIEVIPKLGHDAVARANASVVESLTRFFGA